MSDDREHGLYRTYAARTNPCSCAACRFASVMYQDAYRARRRAELEANDWEGIKHGGAYCIRLGCPRPECRLAESGRRRARYAKGKAGELCHAMAPA